jgi:hypothetical protein
MKAEEAEDIIRDKATRHKEAFPTFNIERFLAWIHELPPMRKGLYCRRSIPSINKTMKNDLRGTDWIR